MTDVRVGVIGLGNIGAEHVAILHRSVPGAVVTMVAGPGRQRTGSVAALADARATSDSYALIADPQVDAIVIASPDSTHADLAIAAIRAGKPVMCEKPLALTVDECLRVLREEQRAQGGPLVSLGFMRRFDPAYAELKAALAAGRCGIPLMMRCLSRNVSFNQGANSELSIRGSAVHEFDIVPWLLTSAITEVAWHAPRISAMAGFQDPQLILLYTESGVLAVVELFLNARYGYDIRCEIVGERGAIGTAHEARLVTASARAESTAFPDDWRSRFADAYRLELQAWVGAIALGRQPTLATAYDGLAAAAVAEAVVASMKSDGSKVAVRVPAA